MDRMLVKQFGWSLYDIDRTDMENLLLFLQHYGDEQKVEKERAAYCDEVDFL